MNAKLRVFTSKATFLTAVLLGLSAHVTSAQTAFDKIQDNSFWNDGRNLSGIRGEKAVKASFAEIYGGITSGDFKPSYEASSFYQAGAKAKTRVDLGKFSMVGSFSFNQEQGKGMNGSMFIKPGYYPVDILEFTPGNKTLQTYSFSGGIAVPLDNRWTIGAKMDFESDNYAKRKDIRHTNYRLDMTIAPSATLKLDRWTVGAAGIFNKNSESIQAEQIGTATAESYYAFLDKGMMYGVQQVWNGSGIHLSESGLDRFAVKEYSYGASAQVERNLSNGAIYADVEWVTSQGEVGEKSYTFFKFPGRNVKARLGIRHSATSGTSIFRISYNWFRQWNNEFVIDKISSGGVTTPVTYGQNQIFERRRAELAPEYSFYGSGRLSWLYYAHAKAGYSKRTEQSSAVYPYSFNADDEIVSLSASALFQLGQFRLGCGIDFLKGFRGEDYGSASSEAGNGSAPFRPESWYNLWNEWENAARLGTTLSLRYDFSIGRTRGLFAEARGSMLHGFDIIHCSGANRYGGEIKLGYEF